MFKDHVRRVIERKNTVTGKRYREDPGILAWNIANEMRCQVTVVVPAACAT